MNIKITEDSLTFKISEAELNILLAGLPLERKIKIGSDDFTMAVTPCSSESALTPVLNRAEASLSLHIGMMDVQKLSVMGKNRDGLSAQADGLNVYLQVDVRKDSREKVKNNAS